MRRMRKQPKQARNDWDYTLEVGDRVYTWIRFKETAVIDDLVKSNGRNKAAAGELTPIRVTKNGQNRIAIIKNGVWYWID